MCIRDIHHPAVLRAIKMTIEAGHRHGIWVGICGELGADTALTETFLRMGAVSYTHLDVYKRQSHRWEHRVPARG